MHIKKFELTLYFEDKKVKKMKAEDGRYKNIQKSDWKGRGFKKKELTIRSGENRVWEEAEEQWSVRDSLFLVKWSI